MASVTSSNLVKQEKVNEQLQREATANRINVSQACEELKTFCESNVRDDTLVYGIPAANNPYKEKGKCNLL